MSVTICVAAPCVLAPSLARAQLQTPIAPVASSSQSPAPTPAKGAFSWPWIAFGLGGIGLGMGTVTGVLSADNNSQTDSPHTLGLISVASFVAAGVCTAAGVTLLLLQPPAGSTPATSGLVIVPVVEPGSIGVVGQF